MRKLYLLLIFVAMLHANCFAKIWRVNNMPGVTADFTTAQAAHDGAGSGDTIHLEPSVNNYGSVACTKPLTWLSIGYFLTENPGNQFSGSAAILNRMNFNAGSDGSKVSVISNENMYVNVPNITIYRSHTNYIDGRGMNLVINQCYIGNYVGLFSTNAIVSNNIIRYSVFMGDATTSAIITNNVLNFGGRNEIYIGAANIYNSVFQNNISVKGGTHNFSNSTATYNMFPDANFPSGNNNQLNVDMANVFANSAGTIDKDYQLKTGSPAIATGYGGIDLGAFGGSAPFKLGMQPSIPAITSMSTPSSSGGNTIQVTFSAKGNN